MDCLTLIDRRSALDRYSLILLFFCSLFFVAPIYGQQCNRQPYRSINGFCNNLLTVSEDFGKAGIPFNRILPARYHQSDIFNSMNFPNSPNPRAISNVLFPQDATSGNPENLSSFVFIWGQFLDHDITATKGSRTEAANIPLPADEPLFTNDIMFARSAVHVGSGIFAPRDQTNTITAWIDASQVYGSDEHRAGWLRTFVNGKLKVSTGNLLPYNTLNGKKDGIIDPNAPEMDQIDNGQTVHFVAGDTRAGEQPGLTTLHTLFVREHNRICEELVRQGYLVDETIYQMARQQVGAIMQAITFEQFLPALGIKLSPYSGYDHQRSPDITNIFATAAYRIGHTMVTSELLLLDDNCQPVSEPLSLEAAFFNARCIEKLGLEPILKGLATQQQEAIDAKIVDGLRNFLFSIPQLPGTFGLDLAALNIQRGRDHGLPDYKTVREFYLNQPLTSFEQINDDPIIAQQLADLYNNDLENIDLWVGLLVETHDTNGSMGSTMNEILKTQFEDLRDADFYYYQNNPIFSLAEKEVIRNTSLRDVIRRNTALTNLQADVFFAEDCPLLASCNQIEVKALASQIEITGLIAPFTHIKVFDKTANWAVVAECSGEDCGATQLFDLIAGDYLVEISLYEGYWKNLICQKKVDITLIENSSFDCENILINTDNQLTISGLTAPFSTVKVFDKEAGWEVVADCAGANCGENPSFDLPAGNYSIQINAYQAIWQDLICSKNIEVTIGQITEPNCEDLMVNGENGHIQINGLTAPFSTVKVFDKNAGWKVVADCIGADCAENQLFVLDPSQYFVEITMYQNVWQNEICRTNFDLDLTATASGRNSESLKAKVFPNPTQRDLFVDLKNYKGRTAKITLSNQFGQQLKTIDFEALPANLLKMEVAALPNGWYYLSIQIANALPFTKKIMVSRLY